MRFHYIVLLRHTLNDFTTRFATRFRHAVSFRKCVTRFVPCSPNRTEYIHIAFETLIRHNESSSLRRLGDRPGRGAAAARRPGRGVPQDPADPHPHEQALRPAATGRPGQAAQARAAPVAQRRRPHDRPGPAAGAVRRQGGRAHARAHAAGPRLPTELLPRQPAEPGAAAQAARSLPEPRNQGGPDSLQHLPGQLDALQRGQSQGDTAFRALHRDARQARAVPQVPADDRQGGEPVHQEVPGDGYAGGGYCVDVCIDLHTKMHAKMRMHTRIS